MKSSSVICIALCLSEEERGEERERGVKICHDSPFPLLLFLLLLHTLVFQIFLSENIIDVLGHDV